MIIHQYFLDPGDIGGSRMNQLAIIAAERGHKVTVIAGGVNYCTGRPYDYMKNKKCILRRYAPNIDLIRVKVSERYNKSFFGRLKGYLDFSLRASIRALKLEKHDVIISTSPPLFVGLPGRITAFFKKSKWIFEVRDLWPEFAVTTGVLKNKFLIKLAYLYEKSVYKKCDGLVVLTPAFKKDIVERYSYLEKKIKIFTNAADFDYIHPDQELRNKTRKKLGLEGKIVFMYTGAHGLANGLDQIIEAATLIKAHKNIVFALIGDGMMKQELMSEARKRRLENVLFLDPVSKEEINAYLNAADVCMSILMPNRSFQKVYPNKVFDYMACAKPILNNIIGQTSELIEKAKCGVNIEPEHVQNLAKTVLELAKRKDLEDLGRNGYGYVKKNFDRVKIMNEYIDYVENLVGGTEQ